MPPKRMQGRHAEWFYKASEDELSIHAILKDGAPSTACFLSQQMVEKYLKGFLVFHEQSFAKVHDLLQLETLLLRPDPGVSVLHTDLVLLNRYYIETRYPGDFPEFSSAEAQAAFEAALRVKAYVVSRTQ